MQRDGFSLMEALAATALLAVAMLPIYDMLSALHSASARLDRATQTPFIEASALTLLTTPDSAGLAAEERGALEIDGWRVEWRRRALSEAEAAGAIYGTEMIDIRLEALELTLTLNDYRQTSVHHRLVWTPRYDSLEAFLEAYMETLE